MADLPGKAATVEVHQHVTKRLHVIATALFYNINSAQCGTCVENSRVVLLELTNATMCVDTCIPRSSSQILILAIGNVLK